MIKRIIYFYLYKQQFIVKTYFDQTQTILYLVMWIIQTVEMNI